MCVAILKPGGKSVTKEDMEACFKRNPDGAGFMYPKEGKVVVVKGLFTFDAFWKAYQNHLPQAVTKDGRGVAMSIHFRIGTSGLKDKKNCHPHVVAEDCAFIHNGVMREYEDRTKGQEHKSDTVHFMEKCVRPLYKKLGPNFLSVGNLFEMLKDHVGAYNKMVFMSGSGEGSYYILHASQGSWVDGVWYSNTQWKSYERKTYPLSDGYGEYNGRWSGGWRGRGSAPVAGGTEDVTPKNVASPHGCWVSDAPKHNGVGLGRWFSWAEYEKQWPVVGTGPFEWYLQGKTGPEVKLDDPPFRLYPPGSVMRESPRLPEPQNDGCQGGGCEEPSNTIPFPGMYDHEHCLMCEKRLSNDEIIAENGICTNCMLEVQARE